MSDPRAHLDQLITGFLGLKLGFAEFQRQYSAAYADEEADRDFARENIEFYGTVHERAEWTTQRPSPQERVDGWQDETEFADWLRGFVQSRIP